MLYLSVDDWILTMLSHTQQLDSKVSKRQVLYVAHPLDNNYKSPLIATKEKFHLKQDRNRICLVRLSDCQHFLGDRVGSKYSIAGTSDANDNDAGDADDDDDDDAVLRLFLNRPKLLFIDPRS